MRYKPDFENDPCQIELDRELIEKYKSPLLSFAFIIADVLDGIPVFNKTFLGRKVSVLRKGAGFMELLKGNLLNDLRNYIKCYWPELHKHFIFLSPERQEHFLTIMFKLSPFFIEIDRYGRIWDSLKDDFEPSKAFRIDGPFQDSWGISPSNQIAFLWAHIIRNRAVRWGSILNLIGWFSGRLSECVYATKLDFPFAKAGVGGNTRVLKNQYVQFQKEYGFRCLILGGAKYFVKDPPRPLFYENASSDPYTYEIVNRVEFYKTSIKTIYNSSGNEKVRTTYFKKGKTITKLGNYDSNKIGKSKAAAILTIPER